MFKLILVCLAALLVAHQTDALVVAAPIVGLPRVIPVMGPLGGVRPAVVRPVVGPLGGVRPAVFVGKRDVEETVPVSAPAASRGLMSSLTGHSNNNNNMQSGHKSHSGAKSAVGAAIGAAIGSKLGKREEETPVLEDDVRAESEKMTRGGDDRRAARGSIGAGIGAAIGSKMGKREEQIMNANITECVLSSESSKMICAGVHSLSCDLTSNFAGLGNFSFLVKDLALHKVDLEVVDKVNVAVKESTLEDTNIEKVETIKKVEKHIEPIFQFLAEEEIVEHKIVAAAHTFVNPRDNKPVILSLYSNEDLKDSCLGFRIKEHTCWEKFEQIIETVKPEELEFQLVISQLESVDGKKIDMSSIVAASDSLPIAESESSTPIIEETTTLVEDATTTIVEEVTTVIEEEHTTIKHVEERAKLPLNF